MKRGIAWVLAVVLMSLSMTALAQEETDFKQFSWGAKQAEILAVEGEPYISGKVTGMNAEYLAYKTTAVGMDVILAYYFCDRGLFRVRYVLNEEHSVDEKYIEDYKTFQKALTKKYGETKYVFEEWTNDDKKAYYADDPGRALRYGYLTYRTFWFLDRTKIIMHMSSDNYETMTRVEYISTQISPGEPDYGDDL